MWRCASSIMPLTTAIALLCACAGGESDRLRPADASPAQATITATDYAFDSPDTLAAGWTTFRLVNRGSQPHMGQLVRVDSGRTIDEYLVAYREAFRTNGPRPDWAPRVGGPSVAAPGMTTNATLFLEPGLYVWTCLFNLPDGIPHVVGHGMAEPLVVKGPPANPAQGFPEADIVMQLTEYAFTLNAPLRAGRQMVRVENAGTEAHELSVVRLAPGTSIEDVRAWLQDPRQAPPLDMKATGGGVTSFAPGVHAYFEVDLTPGEYVLLCFVTAPDGRSHIEHGMIQQIRIS